MKYPSYSLAIALLGLTSFNDFANAKNSWDVLTGAQLPRPVSDHSSTYLPNSSNAKAGIYIAGGCDSPNGNTYVDANGLELDFFLCESISDDLHVFHPDTNTFLSSTVSNGAIGRERAKLPRGRYRHAAVAAKGKLWLIGGRTIPEDTIIPEIDVYDPDKDEWTTVGNIPEEFLTSDNGAFANADGSTIYVVGGYNQQYFDPDSLATTFSFETADALAGNNLMFTKRADLNIGRGDIHAVTSADGSKAYVAGGYNSYPCVPLSSTEVYDFATDSWSPTGDLLAARGDGAMVEASGTIFAIGGEINHPDQCAAPELVPPLAHQSLAVNDVEALEYTSASSMEEWVEVADIPEFRFRFSAASDPKTGIAYAFGGQTSFDESCSCFPTTTEITMIDSGILLTGDAASNGGVSGGLSGTTDIEEDMIQESGGAASINKQSLVVTAIMVITVAILG